MLVLGSFIFSIGSDCMIDKKTIVTILFKGDKQPIVLSVISGSVRYKKMQLMIQNFMRGCNRTYSFQGFDCDTIYFETHNITSITVEEESS